MIKGTEYVIFLLFGIVLSASFVPYVNAQLEPGEEGCLVREFREKAYAPFRIVMIGDPAIRNNIDDRHGDEGSRWSLDKSEFEGEDSPSVLNFFTESIDDWRWVVNTEYRIEAQEPRPIRISYQSDNIEFLSETIYRTGFDFCIVFIVAVREAPHIFTEAEILETADKIQEENFEVVGRQIQLGNEEVRKAKDATNIANAFAVVMIVVLIVSGTMQSRGNKVLTKETKKERKLLAEERARIVIMAKQDRNDNNEFRIEVKEKVDNFIITASNEIKSILTTLSKLTDEVPGLVDSYPTYFIGPLKEDDIVTNRKGEQVGQRSNEGIKEAKEYSDPDEQSLEYQDREFGHGDDGDDTDILETIQDGAKIVVDQAGILKQKLFKKEHDTPIKERDEKYYIEYYEEELSGHTELLAEFDLQNDAYAQTGNLDSYHRTKALAILSNTHEKFDPRREIEKN